MLITSDMKKIKRQIDSVQLKDADINDACVISINNKDYEPISFIKTLKIDFAEATWTYETTLNIKEAALFSKEASCMLYHHLSNITDIKKHSHFPVSKNLIKNFKPTK